MNSGLFRIGITIALHDHTKFFDIVEKIYDALAIMNCLSVVYLTLAGGFQPAPKTLGLVAYFIINQKQNG